MFNDDDVEFYSMSGFEDDFSDEEMEDRESEDGRPDEFDYDRFYDIKDEIEEDSDPADMKD